VWKLLIAPQSNIIIVIIIIIKQIYTADTDLYRTTPVRGVYKLPIDQIPENMDTVQVNLALRLSKSRFITNASSLDLSVL